MEKWEREFEEEFGQKCYLVILECVVRVDDETRTMTKEVSIETFKELLASEIEAAKNQYYVEALDASIKTEASAHISINVRQILQL